MRMDLSESPPARGAAVAAAPLLQLRGLSKRYGPQTVVDGIDLDIGEGEFVALMGPSGSGKSTLLNLIAGIDQPTLGDIYIGETCLTRLAPRARSLFRRDHLGFVFQFFNLIPTLTVLENVLLPAELAGRAGPDARRRALALLERVGLAERAGVFPDELSGGEQQRVAVARAFVSHPPLLLADEPTGNLDPETSIGIMQLLYRINRTGTTVVVVTHDREMVDKMRRRVIQLYDGRVIRDQAAGMYATDEDTSEFGARVRSELGVTAPDDHDDGAVL